MGLANIAQSIKKELKADLGKPGVAVVKKAIIRKKRLTGEFHPNVGAGPPGASKTSGGLGGKPMNLRPSKIQK